MQSLVAAMLAALALAALPAHAEQRNFTGPNGPYQGNAYDYGRSTTFTDRNGQFSGSAIQSGNTTNFYDRTAASKARSRGHRRTGDEGTGFARLSAAGSAGLARWGLPRYE
jgi:hypothetical protein